jgi:hypothetical protein
MKQPFAPTGWRVSGRGLNPTAKSTIPFLLNNSLERFAEI